jgi:general stress protein 26
MRKAMLLLTGLFLSASGVTAQGSAASPPAGGTPPSKGALIAAAAELMREARYCALVTLDAQGSPQAREMDPFPAEADLTVWLGTNLKTRKIGEIRREPRVVLYYQAPGGTGYVTLRGRASVVADAVEKAKRFKPEWKAFYKDEHRGADYALIRVTPERLEIVSAKHGIATAPDAWAPAVLDLR